MAVLSDPRLIRENFDTLTEYADKITGLVTTPKSPERVRLVGAWSGALDRIVADSTLSTADRLVAVGAKVSLARLDTQDAPLPPALEKTVRDEVARADRTTTDPYARHDFRTDVAGTGEPQTYRCLRSQSGRLAGRLPSSSRASA